LTRDGPGKKHRTTLKLLIEAKRKVKIKTRKVNGFNLQKQALAPLFGNGRFEGSHDRLVEHVLEALLRESGALHVLDGAKLPGESLPQLNAHRSLLLSAQLLNNRRVIAQVHLGAHDEAWHTGAMVMDLRKPLFFDVFERSRAGDREANEKYIRLRIGEGAEAVVILLTGSIKQTQSVRLVTNHDSYRIVIKYSWDVL